MTHDDTVQLGLGPNGHLELRSATAAVSLAGSPGQMQLGKWFAFAFKTREVKADDATHKGFKARFAAPLDWELRIPLLAVMVIVIVGLVILMKMLKPS
ncbi:MAG: hypothetical protein K1X78_26315 [Verrucomicrobiaceae bacterium]|nr:hypothetical protein [Verrucomicrobiaceae bacterium]